MKVACFANEKGLLINDVHKFYGKDRTMEVMSKTLRRECKDFKRKIDTT